jgi:hypothetical protein
VIKIGGIDLGKHINPIGNLRETKQDGHKAAFPQAKFLRVFSACDVTPRLLDATYVQF